MPGLLSLHGRCALLFSGLLNVCAFVRIRMLESSPPSGLTEITTNIKSLVNRKVTVRSKTFAHLHIFDHTILYTFMVFILLCIILLTVRCLYFYRIFVSVSLLLVRLAPSSQSYELYAVLPTLFKSFRPDFRKNSAARQKNSAPHENLFLEEQIT
jgi:hypothetical protein